MPRKAAQRPGEALRSAVLDRYDLDPHELVLLESVAHTADLIGDLQMVIDRDGSMVDGKPNPAAVEARLQRLTLGKDLFKPELLQILKVVLEVLAVSIAEIGDEREVA